ncbi:hypothetical protein D779_3751 [Imhoffiella purpurea]|uniref:Uncharacterized protein n=1 Tax=Imhoffiella purpurea TaxID=1249627 RepID=W9VBL0_9GAMM|nr:hypothetical protein D779_3751 [Imhoffiella purpurea]
MPLSGWKMETSAESAWLNRWETPTHRAPWASGFQVFQTLS